MKLIAFVAFVPKYVLYMYVDIYETYCTATNERTVPNLILIGC